MSTREIQGIADQIDHDQPELLEAIDDVMHDYFGEIAGTYAEKHGLSEDESFEFGNKLSWAVHVDGDKSECAFDAPWDVADKEYWRPIPVVPRSLWVLVKRLRDKAIDPKYAHLKDVARQLEDLLAQNYNPTLE